MLVVLDIHFQMHSFYCIWVTQTWKCLCTTTTTTTDGNILINPQKCLQGGSEFRTEFQVEACERESANAVPTNKNCALELSTFGIIVGVSHTGVQWHSLALGEQPSWSLLTPAPGKYDAAGQPEDPYHSCAYSPGFQLIPGSPRRITYCIICWQWGDFIATL